MTRHTDAPPPSLLQQGMLQRWRTRWLGERDAVADQLADIARQGSGMARLAHVCASLMLVLFSAGSLVALGGDALLSVLDGAQQGHIDLPAAISLGVSTLLVLCMDVAMLYAASMLRLLGMRRAWINRVTQQEGKPGKFIVNVAGRALRPGRVILKRPDYNDVEQEVLGARNVTFGVPPDTLAMRFVLVNNERELDQAWVPPDPQLVSPSLAPHARLASKPARVHTNEFDWKTAVQLLRESDVLADQQVRLSPEPSPESSTAQGEHADPAQELRSEESQPRVLKIVVASPGEVRMEREAVPRILDDLNHGLAGELNLRLEVWEWETDSYAGFHTKGPQELIDDSMEIEKAAIVIGIFWWRFGTPVSDAASGTEHELMRAYNSWKKNTRPNIMVYFNQEPYWPKNTSELDQWKEVLAFKERFPDEGYWKTYLGSSDFRDKLRRDLSLYLSTTVPLKDHAEEGHGRSGANKTCRIRSQMPT